MDSLRPTLLQQDAPVDLLERFIDEFDVINARSAMRIVEVFARQGRTVSGYPRLRPDDCARVTDALNRAFRSNLAHFRTGDPDVQRRFKEITDAYRKSDVRFYPSEELKLRLLEADMMIASNDAAAAAQLLGQLADRPYSVEGDFETMARLFDLDARVRLAAGQWSDLGVRTLGRVLLLLRLKPWRAWALAQRFSAFLGVNATARVGDGLLAYAAGALSRVYTRRRMRVPPGLLNRVFASLSASIALLPAGLCLRLLVLGDVRWRRQTQDADTKQARQIVVTRAMGGIGDLLMMTPGLRALSIRYRQPIKLLVPKKFFPVFANNRYVELADIDGPPVEQAAIRKWFNLTMCPAAAYEVRKRPFVKKGRVELFAKGMGVGRFSLRRFGWHIHYELSDEQRAFCRDYVQEKGLGDRPIIGVQPYSRDSYKDHPHIALFIQQLAAKYDVVLFHHTSEGLTEGPHIGSTAGVPLALSLGLVSILDAMVCVDSAFLHAAAAFDVPVVALFGPTDGKTFTRHHKYATVLTLQENFRCSPCWRNEDLPCALTASTGLSPCVSGITFEQVDAALAQWLSSRDARPKPGTHSPRDA
jgi:ADP-heptose:LPS heptosyltransferase